MVKGKKIISAIVLIIILPILLINIVVLFNTYINKSATPSFFGWKPFVVLSGSMQNQINIGDIVIVKEIDTKELIKGDVIAFKKDNKPTIHRITEIITEDEIVKYKTKGDNNNTEDIGFVMQNEIEGRYQFKIPRLGGLTMFIKTPTGMVVVLSIPLIILILLQVKDLRKKDE